jgi:hypothetical protein
MQPRSMYLALSPQVPQTEFWTANGRDEIWIFTLRRPGTKSSQLGCSPHKETSVKGRVGEAHSVAAYDDITGCHGFRLVTWLGSGTHGTTSPPKGYHPVRTLKDQKIKQATAATYVPYSLMFHTCEQYSPLVHRTCFCHFAPSVPKNTVLSPLLQ